MNVNSFTTVRVGDWARTNGAARQIALTQSKLGEAQKQLATGRRLTSPSDAPADAAIAQQLRRTLEIRAGYQSNLNKADSVLGRADGALSSVADLLREAKSLGLSALGDGAIESEREAAALAIRAIERQLLSLANTNIDGVSIFGGGRGVSEPFVDAGGGIKFVGGESELRALIGERGASVDLLVDAESVFGSISRRVGDAGLTPQLTAATRLADLRSANGEGVSRGSFRLSNAGATATIDLTQADTIGDVISQINASGVGVAASITGNNEIQLNGVDITITDTGGTIARDLGLVTQTPTPSLTGGDLQPKLTVHTPLVDLRGGAGVDPTGFTIRNGSAVDNVSFAGLATVGDLLNRLNDSPAHVAATISDDGSSLRLRNPVQGVALTVQENGGTSTADLGWLTFTANDPLTDLNGGRGVRTDPAVADLQLTDTGGIGFEVDLDGTATVQDVIDAINTAATSAGSTLSAAFDPATPGVRLTNVAAISDAGSGNAVTDLGLDLTIAAGVLSGRDVNAVSNEGVFGHLRALAEALERDDGVEASLALLRLEQDEVTAIDARGEVGTRVREIQQRIDYLSDEEVVTRDLLSRVEDIDYATAVLEYQTLQTSLQAQLQTTAQLLGLSLFDFLR